MSPTEASSCALRSALAIETFCAETLLCKSAALAKFRMAGIMVGSAITVHFPGQFSRVFLPDGYCPLGKFLLQCAACPLGIYQRLTLGKLPLLKVFGPYAMSDVCLQYTPKGT